MTESQIDYLIALHDREGEMQELPLQFPEIDWRQEYVRWREAREAAWAARREATAGQPQSRISLDEINQIAGEVYRDGVKDMFTNSPLLASLRKR